MAELNIALLSANTLMRTDSPETENQQKTFTISELNRFVKNLLETSLSLIWIEGEISNFSQPASGHWYFSLKDANAQVRCAMFKARNARVKIKPKAGMKVRIRARVGLYETRGEYQIIAEHMEEFGFGLLQQRYEALKAQLLSEGLFDRETKKPIPAHPKHIAVITSATGAAITDVLSVLSRRSPSLKVTIIPSLVQGETSPDALVEALKLGLRAERFDLILLCRGGGSLEDLWAFNSEKLARCIASYPLPIISAVGHEIDFTIADFVADLRAPTPSAAAEILSEDKDQLITEFKQLEKQLKRSVNQLIDQKDTELTLLKNKIKHPKDKLNFISQNIDHLESDLKNAITLIINKRANVLEKKTHSLSLQHPQLHITRYKQAIRSSQEKLLSLQQSSMNDRRNKLMHIVKLLDIASPLATLRRGYAIAKDSQGRLLKDVKAVKPNEQVTIKLANGSLGATVKTIQPD